MARIARVAAPGIPHHVTQRGNRRQQTFFNDEDHQAYRELMSGWCTKYKFKFGLLSYADHVHQIAVPKTKDGLKFAVCGAHRPYARRVNYCQGWCGHLWQGRFSTFILDEYRLLACARFAELNMDNLGCGICGNCGKVLDDFQPSERLSLTIYGRADDVICRNP